MLNQIEAVFGRLSYSCIRTDDAVVSTPWD